MSDLADLKQRIAAAFAEVTGRFGASVMQQSDTCWTARSGPARVVELELAETEAGVRVLMRSGSMKAELSSAVCDEQSLKRAESFIRTYAPKPLCTGFGSAVPPAPSIARPAANAIQLLGGGSTVELLEQQYTFGFMNHPGGADQIIFAFYTAAGLKNALLTPDSRGVLQPVRVPDAPSPDELLRVTPGPIGSSFEIADLNRRIVVPFNRECTVHSTRPGTAWSFEQLTGRERDEGVILVRGPLHGAAIPKLPQLTLPDQKVIATSTDEDDLLWLENEYLFEGLSFRQFHCYAELDRESAAIVTAQARTTHIDGAREQARRIARSTRWMQRHENPDRAH